MIKTIGRILVLSLVICFVATIASADELHDAAEKGDLSEVKKLLNAGTDVNARNSDEETALMKAVGTPIDAATTKAAREMGTNIIDFPKRSEIVEALLDKGALPNLEDNGGRTALMYAVRVGIVKTVNVLIRRGANINQKDKRGGTALMYATLDGNTEAVKCLLDNKAETDAKQEAGLTALMMAARDGHTEIVDLLLAKGANPNITNDARQTALIFAAGRGGKKYIVESLIKHGADRSLQDKHGWTALMYAEKADFRELVDLLKKSK
jgi:ankyrin repeat protein